MPWRFPRSRSVNLLVPVVLALLVMAGCARAPHAVSTSPVMPIPSGAQTAGFYHTVTKGETLYHIAKANGLDVKELMRANRMSTSDISTGQNIFIPRPAVNVPSYGITCGAVDLTAARAAVGQKRFNSRWNYITVHHSGTTAGSGVLFHRDHKRRGMGGLFYHFVIGNGTYSQDGAIETGWRWKRQVSSKRNRPHDIQICLVGNFDVQDVSSAEFDSLISLITVLRQEYGVPLSNVRGHRDIPGKRTDCPGKRFPFAKLKQCLTSNPVSN